MSTADDVLVLVPVQLSSPPGHILFFVFVLGFAGSSLVHLIRLYFKSGIGIEARNIVKASEDHTSLVSEVAERVSDSSLPKFRIEQVGVNDDDRENMILDGKKNSWFRWIARLGGFVSKHQSSLWDFADATRTERCYVVPEFFTRESLARKPFTTCEDFAKKYPHNSKAGVAIAAFEDYAGVGRDSLEPTNRVNILVDGKYSRNKEASGAAFKSHVGVFRYSQLEEAARGACEYHCGSRDFYVGDQCHHPKCWMSRSQKNRYLEVLLMFCAFLLSFANSGAFYFIQALSIVGIHDQFLKHSLAAFKWVFVASFFCNFLGVLVCLILQSCREYHSYKKFTLIISNTTSFLLMVIGYGLLISFNMKV